VQRVSFWILTNVSGPFWLLASDNRECPSPASRQAGLGKNIALALLPNNTTVIAISTNTAAQATTL
jgi:hypothetical protein